MAQNNQNNNEQKTESLYSPELTEQPIVTSTQEFLDIAEVRDSTVVLKDGSIRAIVLVSSLNFALKSIEEQDAIVSAYQGFLNSLDFPVQIIIQSRELDIDTYLKRLESAAEAQTNELLHLQTLEYMNYISQLVEISSIMSKDFYIVVAFSPTERTEESIGSKFRDILNPTRVIKQSREKFQAYRDQLWRRVDQVSLGLSSLGLRSVGLNTQELIELFYNVYNPETSYNQDLASVAELRVDTSNVSPDVSQTGGPSAQEAIEEK